MKNKTQSPKCNNPNCRSNFGYFRLSTGEWVCRMCGNAYVVKRDNGGETK